MHSKSKIELDNDKSLVLGETIVPTTYIGLILIVAGLIYNQYFVSTPSPQPSSQPINP